MLFNSPEFIFAFLPAALAVFFLLGRASRGWALAWVVLASLFYYAWWNPINVLIIGPSLLVNFFLARRIHAEERQAVRRFVLIAGIAFNVLFLGYFKYLNFAETTLNEFVGTSFVVEQVILPLGISFITFQKIAFLIDVHARQVKSFSFREFCLFILFFPQLIAGPIVHFRETMPQFKSASCRLDSSALSIGLTLFCFGLFKKVVLADGIAAHVTPIYDLSASGGTVTMIPAWFAAIGFTLQIYFDFSGYSDMALGLARCFGIRLPVNFDSPLKASNIIDFWLRWHVTLTRFLTAYVYNPLALSLTRRRAAKGRPLLGRKPSAGAFLYLLALPTVLTMVVSGVWHGAGLLFVLWGFVHGILISINHGWRLLVPHIFSNMDRYERIMRPAGFVLTFISVCAAMVLFRSSTGAGAAEILSGLIGANGVSLPRGLLEPLGLVGVLPFIGVDDGGAVAFVVISLWVAALTLIVVLMPNTMQLMARFEPALDFDERPGRTQESPGQWAWRPTLSWGCVVSVFAVIAVLRLGGPSEFLYWQF